MASLVGTAEDEAIRRPWPVCEEIKSRSGIEFVHDLLPLGRRCSFSRTGREEPVRVPRSFPEQDPTQ